MLSLTANHRPIIASHCGQLSWDLLGTDAGGFRPHLLAVAGWKQANTTRSLAGVLEPCSSHTPHGSPMHAITPDTSDVADNFSTSDRAVIEVAPTIAYN
jgi:hypothetical protein